MHPHIEALLKNTPVWYKEHLHTGYPAEINNPSDFATALGYSIERITKSVFIRTADRKRYAMAVCSVNKKLNFPVLASSLDAKKVEVATKEELDQKVGYPVTGVAPIGLKDIPVFMDSALLGLETVLVGGGVSKVEIEIRPADLQSISGATVLPITL